MLSKSQSYSDIFGLFILNLSMSILRMPVNLINTLMKFDYNFVNLTGSVTTINKHFFIRILKTVSY
jgi:hypothetical protein